MDVVYATATVRVELPSGGYGVVYKGTHWPADDPVVSSHPEAFSTDPRYGMNFSVEPAGYNAPIEQATANPGERRVVSPRADSEAEELRAELTRLGRPVDGRWTVKRLREELEKVDQ